MKLGMNFSRSPDERDSYTRRSPEYNVFSSDMMTTVGVAAGLMILTIVGMILSANSPLSEFGLMVYNLFWILGVLLFGGLISIGRWIGLKGVSSGSYFIAIVGSLISVFAYSWFGGMVLTMFSVSIYGPVILITSIITILITLVAMAIVYSTDRDLGFVGVWSGGAFIIGIILGLVGSFAESIQIIAFGFFLLGFILDLTFEIWMVSDDRRSPVANGIAVYVAFAGVFVHILQLVAEAYSE